MLFGRAVWVGVLLFEIDGKNHYQIYNNNNNNNNNSNTKFEIKCK